VEHSSGTGLHLSSFLESTGEADGCTCLEEVCSATLQSPVTCVSEIDITGIARVRPSSLLTNEWALRPNPTPHTSNLHISWKPPMQRKRSLQLGMNMHLSLRLERISSFVAHPSTAPEPKQPCPKKSCDYCLKHDFSNQNSRLFRGRYLLRRQSSSVKMVYCGKPSEACQPCRAKRRKVSLFFVQTT
jgi:hypothetical protein